MFKLPYTIMDKRINTDFREWMKIGSILSNTNLLEREKQYIVLKRVFGEIPKNIDDYLDGILSFYLCGKPKIESEHKERILDWEHDAQLIRADFKLYANIDLAKTKMHWWEFDAMFMSLPHESGVKTAISARCIDPSDYKDSKARRQAMRVKASYSLSNGTEVIDDGE